jgi:hypothetical protein
MSKNTKSVTFEVDPNNIQAITNDQMEDADKAEFEAHMNIMKSFALHHMVKLKVESSRRILCQHLSKSPSQPILKGSKT